MVQNRPLPWFAVVSFLFVLGLACGPCGLLAGPLPTPPHRVRLSTEAGERLEARMQQNLEGAPGQRFVLSMTDSEVSSLVEAKLSQYGRASPVYDPVIWFTRDRIHGTGRLVHVLPVEADFFLVAKANVRDGMVVVEIEQVRAGAVTIPDSVLEMLSRSVNETIDELQLGIEITDLKILEGQAVVQGIRR